MASEEQLGNQGLSGASRFVDLFGGKAGFVVGGAPKQPEIIIGQIVQGLLAFIGVIFGILIIYGGYLWMTARGNEEVVKKSFGIIKNAAIGFIITLGAYAIATFVVNNIILSI